MTEIATVLKIEGGTVTVSCAPSQSCARCGSALCGERKDRVFPARNGSGLDLAAGDAVEIHLAPNRAIAAGFVVLIVPLFLFAAGYAGAALAWPSSVEGLRVLAGLAGLGLGFLGVFLLGRIRQELPDVTRKLSSGSPGPGD
jgi:positive regulator of sigma E activity